VGLSDLLQAIRMEVALRADVDAFEVSLPLLIEALPQFGLQGYDGIVECVRQGRRLGIIRPSTRLRIEAPEIPRELLIPLPKDSVLCRQPHYPTQTSSDKPIEGGKPVEAGKPIKSDKQSGPNIEVHPDRDRIVAILREREALLRTAARQEKAKEPLPRPKAVSTKSKAETTNVSLARVVPRPISPVQPDASIVRPPWTFLRPLLASA
jgi:hypothetical protein